MLCAQGPHNKTLKAAFPFYAFKCVPPLAHGPLAKHLAGYYERCACLFHIFFGKLMHIYAAVHTRVNPLAVSILRVPYNLYVIKPLLQNLYGNTEFIGDPYCLAPACAIPAVTGAECRCEVKRNNINPLLKHHLDCQG